MTTRGTLVGKAKDAGARLLRVALVAACALSTAGFDANQTPLDPAGPHAGGISRLWWVFFFALASVYVVVMIVFLFAVARGRARRKLTVGGVKIPPPAFKPDEGSERRAAWIVGAATALSTVVLFALLVSSFLTGRGLSMTRSDEGALTIEVTGHQWWWEARYDDVTPSNIFTTANEIHIPVGVPVIIRLKSTDVIHSFWVPNLAGKKDAIPGKSSSVWLRVDRAGVYRGQCAEYCGMQHAHMALTVVAEPPEKFWAWVAAQRQPAPEPSTDAVRQGRQVFLSSPCIMCHTVRGTPANSVFGPNLTHVASRGSIAANTLPNTREHLAGWVSDAQSVKPGSMMPTMSLSAEDLQAVIDYLQSLK
jgi:cytochrome c oxidase subunit 2